MLQMKGERMARRSSFGSKVRKRLSDITNLQLQTKPGFVEEKQPQFSPTKDAFVDHLIKEKMTLMKLIEERNKIIEMSGAEIQNLRLSLQKLQAQNWNLAQTNSQLLAEVNLGRDRLKALQHELSCKNALMKAKNLIQQEAEEKNAVLNCQKTQTAASTDVLEEGEETVGGQLCEVDEDDKLSNRNRKCSNRSKSMGASTSCKRGVDKEKTENKRRCVRRQSARFSSQEQVPADLFEIEDAKADINQQLTNTPEHKECSVPLDSIKKEAASSEPRTETHGSRKTSLGGRPLRKATAKVASYKEIPVNVKMRRPR